MVELRDLIVQRLRSDPTRKVRNARSGGLEFRCPTAAHADSTPSAWLGDGGWKCLGCDEHGSLLDLAELLGLDVPATNGYTLEAYADDKRFPASQLREWGLSTETVNGQSVLAIPYLDDEGKLLRRRFRAGPKRWWEGRHRPIHLCGLDRLVDLKPDDPILVVEGESDVHAAWLGGLPAIGVPGATTWKSEWKHHLSGLRHSR